MSVDLKIKRYSTLALKGSFAALSLFAAWVFGLTCIPLFAGSYAYFFHYQQWLNFKRDVYFLSVLMPNVVRLNSIANQNQQGKYSTILEWNKAVAKFGPNVHLIFQDESYTYRDVDILSNKVANWGLSVGLKQGDVVAVNVSNSPQFIFIVIGMMKIGVITSLINTNIHGKGLLHCMNISRSKLILFCSETLQSIKQLREIEDENVLESYCIEKDDRNDFGKYADFSSFSDETVDPKERDQVKCSDEVCCIYTSGTTGLPKAAKMTHVRMAGGALSFVKYNKLHKTSRMYNVLPLYHTSGLIIGYMSSWPVGSSVIIRSKFSASQFFEECCKYGATHAMYIGELCRYLCNTVPSKFDTQHKLQLCTGNGLRPDVWRKFVRRFQIPSILEFYGATEGNCTLINTANKEGAVGFLSTFMKTVYPARILRMDAETNEPIRGMDGFCVECQSGEIGQIIGRVDPSNCLKRFDGYKDKKASEKKVLTDVFRKGDMYFLSGDLVSIDQDDFVYFKDRMGDTFRWKGENCSSSEVAEALTSVPGDMIYEAVVYGVPVAGHDGKCGMAFVKKSSKLDLRLVYSHLKESLATYSIPLFLRLSEDTDVEITGTFKHRKMALREEGFDPERVNNDELYYLNRDKGMYISLTKEVYQEIVSGKIRL